MVETKKATYKTVQPVKQIAKATIQKPKQKTTRDPSIAITIGKKLGIQQKWSDGIREASKHYGIHPMYLFIIGSFAENLGNPRAKGDGGCSLGGFQINRCVREDTVHVRKPIKECAKDPYCSADWTASNIVNTYGCIIDQYGYIENPMCLKHHNGTIPKKYYPPKIRKGINALNKIMEDILQSKKNKSGTRK